MKLTEPKMFDILNKLLGKEKLSALEKQIIFQDSDGNYNLFGTYLISKDVLEFVVEKKHTFTSHAFTDLKIAVTWATLDLCGNINGAARVLYLDQLLSGIIQNMKVHENLCKRTKDYDQLALYTTKLTEGRVKRQSASAELARYTERCKEWQYKQFAQNSAK